MKEFKSVVSGLTTLKAYLEKTIIFNQKIDPHITKQLTIEQGGKQAIVFKDTYLNDEYKFDPILSQLQFN